ncbi:MAG: MerR family transcriptional regulator [Acidobacteriota bacterium]
MADPRISIPDRPHFKIGEVCRITDTQPYVLRFWESEFPSLAPQKTRSGQRVYLRSDIETILRIKHLLYEESYTIAGARKRLESADSGQSAAKVKTREPAPRAAEPPKVRDRLEYLRGELQDLLALLGSDDDRST